MKKITKLSLILFVFLISGCEKYFFYPQKVLYYMPETCKYAPENLIVETDKGKLLHGWYFKTNVKKPKGTIFFLHGNSNNISTESVGMLWVIDKGYNLLTFDYRGYGLSQGKPNIEGVLYDGLEFVDAIMKDNKVDKKNLIIHGQSLGGAVASHIAAFSPYADKFKVLILESTFTSWKSVSKEIASKNFLTWAWQYPISWGITGKYSSLENLKASKIKNTIIIHSKKDNMIGYKNAESLFEISHEPKVILSDDFSSHAAIMQNPRIQKEYMEYLDKFIK